jgi:hypothetical protein
MILYFVLFCLCLTFLIRSIEVESFVTKELSLDQFRKEYDTDLLTLPENLFALGINDNVYQTYGKHENGKDLIKYWIEHLHPSLEKKKYYVLICPLDGYLEYAKHTDEELTEVVPSNYQQNQYIENVIGETEYPVFHKKKTVFAMCKKINDKHTVLITDRHFIVHHGYEDTLKKIDQHRKPFKNRLEECIWRGTIQNGTKYNFFDMEGKDGLNQRMFFKQLHGEGRFPKVNFKDEKTSIEDQIKFKYILDIDGYSSTWDATVWKLYSGSILLKTKSKWKQWYYDELRAWEHYIPIENDFSDLNDKIEWCIHNEERCINIIENSRKFVLNRLNWGTVKKECIEAVKKKI